MTNSNMPRQRIHSQTDKDSYRYKGTKRSEAGQTQREYEDTNYPGRAESLYVEQGPEDTPPSAYKGRPGGWAGMNYYREDDHK